MYYPGNIRGVKIGKEVVSAAKLQVGLVPVTAGLFSTTGLSDRNASRPLPRWSAVGGQGPTFSRSRPNILLSNSGYRDTSDLAKCNGYNGSQDSSASQMAVERQIDPVAPTTPRRIAWIPPAGLKFDSQLFGTVGNHPMGDVDLRA
jgi:hypothetical protein